MEHLLVKVHTPNNQSLKMGLSLGQSIEFYFVPATSNTLGNIQN